MNNTTDRGIGHGVPEGADWFIPEPRATPWKHSPPTIAFCNGDRDKPVLTIDMSGPVDILIGEGVTLTEAAEHFLAECRRILGIEAGA